MRIKFKTILKKTNFLIKENKFVNFYQALTLLIKNKLVKNKLKLKLNELHQVINKLELII